MFLLEQKDELPHFFGHFEGRVYVLQTQLIFWDILNEI